MASISVNNSAAAACAVCCLPLGTEPSTPHFASPSLSLSLSLSLCQTYRYLSLLLQLLPLASLMVAKVYPNADLSAFAGMSAQAGSDAVPLKCPRCDSSNTKFCYFNNYSLAQPRHFCKACKRYWTRGGTLRNVPVGGGCRKNKRNKKPQSAPLAKEPVRWLASSLPIPAAELSSMIYGMPSTNSPNLFFPGFDLDAQLSGYEEAFRSGIGARRSDLQLSNAGGEYCRVPLPSSDDLSIGISEGLDLTKGIPMDAVYSSGGSGFPGMESSNLNWNQAGFSYGWPEYGSSVAPLF